MQHERALALVTEGLADVAVTIKPAKHPDLVFDEIASDVAHLVCARNHPLARRKTARWRDLAGLDFIGITAISSVRRLTDAAFIDAEIAIEPRYEVEQIPSAAALVEAGLGVTALPSLTFSIFKGRNLVVRPLIEPSLRRNVGFVTLKGRTLPANSDKLMRFIRHEFIAGTEGPAYSAWEFSIVVATRVRFGSNPVNLRSSYVSALPLIGDIAEEPASQFGAFAYDALHMLVDVYRKNKTTDPAKTRDTLETMGPYIGILPPPRITSVSIFRRSAWWR